MKDRILNIGNRVEPFVDDWIIDRMDGINLKMHNPVDQEVVFKFDKPWEDICSGFMSVSKDGDIYRNWYRAGQDSNQFPAYVESSDGVSWTRPNLRKVEFNGSLSNNILFDDPTTKNMCVFIDTNPSANPKEKYKAIAHGPKINGRATIRGLTSPDGIDWTITDTDPLLTAPQDKWPMFDSTNIAFWDENQKQYVAYMRGWVPGTQDIFSDHHGGVRSIRRSLSKDFHNWSEPEFIDLGGAPLEHLYTNAATPYFRAPHIYLMFPRRFVAGRKNTIETEIDGVSDTVFMTSRDGFYWDRRFMEPFISAGLDQNNWTDRSLTVAAGVLQTGPEEMSIYYKEHNRLPSCRMRRASLRLDGFVSVNAPYQGGQLITKPIICTGDNLAINYSTSAIGSITVELQEVHGSPIPGFELENSMHIFGDHIERTVRWKNVKNLAEIRNRPIRIRFVMEKSADIYSLSFK